MLTLLEVAKIIAMRVSPSVAPSDLLGFRSGVLGALTLYLMPVHNFFPVFEKKFFLPAAKNRSGQVLVETMVALSVATVGILGTMSLLAQSMASAKFVGDQYVASYLAAEGIENVKFEIDSAVMNNSGWGVPSTTPIDEQLGWDSSSRTYSVAGKESTEFTRKVGAASSKDGAFIEVSSTVSWPLRGGGTDSVTLVDHFYHWR